MSSVLRRRSLEGETESAKGCHGGKGRIAFARQVTNLFPAGVNPRGTKLTETCNPSKPYLIKNEDDMEITRVGMVLDQDRSTKPGMRNKTEVFLPSRTVVPAMSIFIEN